MIKYTNGNAEISLYEDGTRVIEFENNLQLDYPLNIDIRVSTQCSFGMKPDGTSVLCTFCHESAKTNGKECDYELLKLKLQDLPKGIELAIGCNSFTINLYEFLQWCKEKGFVCNLTVNQGHIKRDLQKINSAISDGIIKGLGISYRSSLKFDVPDFILNYENTVFHVISGIDSIEEVKSLKDFGVKKILILGEKDFGFNKGNVDLNTTKHKHWLWYVRQLFDLFQVVSFDNLGLEQLKIKRFFNDENWNVFNQGEHSFYINAVDCYFAPSSRSDNKEHWDYLSIKDYFKTLEKY